MDFCSSKVISGNATNYEMCAQYGNDTQACTSDNMCKMNKAGQMNVAHFTCQWRSGYQSSSSSYSSTSGGPTGDCNDAEHSNSYNACNQDYRCVWKDNIDGTGVPVDMKMDSCFAAPAFVGDEST